ncbi:MAG: hypothetical protein AAF490_22025 [Chloroflexota bacterium]
MKILKFSKSLSHILPFLLIFFSIFGLLLIAAGIIFAVFLFTDDANATLTAQDMILLFGTYLMYALVPAVGFMLSTSLFDWLLSKISPTLKWVLPIMLFAILMTFALIGLPLGLPLLVWFIIFVGFSVYWIIYQSQQAFVYFLK